MQHEISLRELNSTGRHWMYYAFIGGASVVTLAIMFIGPLLTGQENSGYLALAIVGFEALLILGGIVWFALLVTSRRGVSKRPRA